MLELKKNPTKRDVVAFAISLAVFFGALGGIVLWRPDALIGAAAFMVVAWLVSLVINRNDWHMQVLGFFLPLLFLVIGGIAQSGANQWAVAIGTWIVGILAAAATLVWPKLGRLAYSGWMLAAFPIGWTVSHLVLALTYYLVFTPIGLVMRLFGWDPLERRFDPNASTYWVEHKPADSPTRYFQQF